LWAWIAVPLSQTIHQIGNLARKADVRILLPIVQLMCYPLRMKSASIEAVTYSHARQNLKAVMDTAINDSIPVVVTRRNGKAVVILSLDTWNASNETDYLLSTPANKAALLESIAALDRGEGIEVEFGPDGNLIEVVKAA
jgi:antitoxin YefM